MSPMVDADRPLIALNGVQVDSRGEPSLKLHHRYSEAVLRAGGIPIALTPVGGPRDIERVLERVDGVVLCGGDDFDTERLGLGAVHPKAVPTPTTKQDYDLALTRAILAAGMPVLGVCFGMQCLGLVAGSGLLQHLPDQRPGGQDHTGGREHPVQVDPESKLASILGVECLPVISRHHQALTDVPAPWRVVARDGEDLVEAIEHTTLPFAVGVQWHPELAPEGGTQDRLFRALIHAASLARADRLYTRTQA